MCSGESPVAGVITVREKEKVCVCVCVRERGEERVGYPKRAGK